MTSRLGAGPRCNFRCPQYRLNETSETEFPPSPQNFHLNDRGVYCYLLMTESSRWQAVRTSKNSDSRWRANVSTSTTITPITTQRIPTNEYDIEPRHSPLSSSIFTRLISSHLTSVTSPQLTTVMLVLSLGTNSRLKAKVVRPGFVPLIGVLENLDQDGTKTRFWALPVIGATH